MSADFLVVTTTVGGEGDARSLAQALVEARLAACVQMFPIHSIYRWQDTVETTPEHLLMCKIRSADFDAVAALIRTKHAYEVPEIVAVSIVAGSPAYLGWLTEATAR